MKKLDKFRKWQNFRNKIRLPINAFLFLVGLLILSMLQLTETKAQTLGTEYAGWKSNTTFVVKMRCDENGNRIDEFHLKLEGSDIALITDNDDAPRPPLVYINLEDFNSHNYDGFYDDGKGTFTFTKKVVSNDEAYWIIEWTPAGITDNTKLNLTFEHKWCTDGGGSPGSKNNSLATFFTKALPEAANVNIAAAAGSTTITWDPPSIPTGLESGLTFSTIIKKDGTEVGSVGITETTFTNPSEGGKYEVIHKLVYSYSNLSFSWELVGNAGGGTTPELPRVKKPVGVKATQDRCDGKVLVTWDYNGSIDPEKFTVNGVDVPSDMREYEDDIGAYSTQTYKVTAEGTVNSEESSEVTVKTTGDPAIPTNFTATAGTNTITLSWTGGSNVKKYLLRRTSSTGSSDFELTDVTPGGKTYDDKNIKGCESYKYQLFASNPCTEAAGLAGISAVAQPEMKIRPDMSAYMQIADASKAYFPDKVKIEWSITASLTLANRFIISRRVYNGGTFKQLGVVEGALSYDDETADGRILYEYQIYAEADCGNEILPSNKITAIGFRLPYGVVNGHIEYENGVAVKDVQVMAERNSSIVAGSSLLFSGGNVSINDAAFLKPDAGITIEAFVKPTTLSGIHPILSVNLAEQVISLSNLMPM